MAKYIDKDTLIAEIERRLDKLSNTSADNNREFSAIIGAQHYELISLVQYINTLEVKEVKEPADVLIEKACKYISCHQCEYIDFDDFKNYMKGE